MYPLLRFGLESFRTRDAAPLPLGEPHVCRVRCWPWDLDPWIELNNGRALTLYDIGRLPLFARSGLVSAARAAGWGITVAGSSVRYRRRVRAFDLLEMRSAFIGRDDRFLYLHQATFRDGDATSAALIRSAVTGPDGIVPTGRVVAALGRPDWRPALPAWVESWIASEAARTWPPNV